MKVPGILALLLAVGMWGTTGDSDPTSKPPSDRFSVYAKIILPMKPTVDGSHPIVESWVAEEISGLGEASELRAVTDWNRLADPEEIDTTFLWDSVVDGKGQGCPVNGHVAQHTDDGKLRVELPGWGPVPCEIIKGETLLAEIGACGVAVVDRGRSEDGKEIEQDYAYVALIVSPVDPEKKLTKKSSSESTVQDVAKQVQNSADEQQATVPTEITLSIGDGFVFGESEARQDNDRDDRDELDLYVQDIRHGVSLSALVGCTVPAQPMTSVGMPEEPLKLFALLKDAPQDLPKRDVWLLPKCSQQRPGIGLVKSRSGKIYKLCLVSINGHPEALKRTVRIAYEPVPQAKDGGVLQLPKAVGQPDAKTTAAIREALRIGTLIPGDSFARDINGDYAAVSNLTDGYVPQDDAHIALATELNTSVKIENSGSLFAGAGIGEEGSVLLDAYGAIGVQGPMLGRIDLESYGYIYVDGPMVGTLNLDSYATVVLKQGLTGTVLLRSYADMLIQGPITGTIDADGSCWSTLYFDGNYSTAKLAAMSPAPRARGDFQQITLHVRESDDLAVGEHKNVGSWRKVIVGDPFWKTLE